MRVGTERTKVLLLGGTGLAGQAFGQILREDSSTAVHSASRRDDQIELDVSDIDALCALLDRFNPDVVVNTVAVSDLRTCEEDPGQAWITNARPLSVLAQWSRRNNRALLHISTDHFFTDRPGHAHRETDPVTLVNEYARTKYAAEALALTTPHSLVVRTSIVGVRGWSQPTFAEWALRVVNSDERAMLFNDAFTSSIDVLSLARLSWQLLRSGVRGLYNVAASEVYTKEAFVREVATQLGRQLTHASAGSATTLQPKRALSLGLNVRRAERILGRRLPTLAEVVESVLRQDRERRENELRAVF